MNIKINLDAMGIATSVACAIHCAFLPLLISSLPILGINIIHNLVFEWGMIGLAFIVGSYSLFHGYVKHHRLTAPLLIFAAGFIFLVFKQVVPQFEYLFLSIAVVLIITAHFYNYCLCHLSKCRSRNQRH